MASSPLHTYIPYHTINQIPYAKYHISYTTYHIIYHKPYIICHIIPYTIPYTTYHIPSNIPYIIPYHVPYTISYQIPYTTPYTTYRILHTTYHIPGTMYISSCTHSPDSQALHYWVGASWPANWAIPRKEALTAQEPSRYPQGRGQGIEEVGVQRIVGLSPSLHISSGLRITLKIAYLPHSPAVAFS